MNSINLRYFKYYFAKNWHLLVAIAVIFVLCGFNSVTKVLWQDMYELSLGYLGAFLSLLGVVMPCVQFMSFDNKRNLDTIYSFPISRKALFIIHYLTGILYTAIAYFVGSLVALCRIHSVAKEARLSVGPFAWYVVVNFIVFLIVYTILTMAFIAANSDTEGALIIVGYIVVPFIVLYAAGLIIKCFVEDKVPVTEYTLGLHTLFITNNVSELTEHSMYGFERISEFNYIPLIIDVVVGLICGVLAYRTFIHKKAELIGGPSDSPLGLTMLIPLGSLFLMIILGDIVLAKLMMVPFIYLLYVIHRRSAKIGKVNFIILGIITLIAAIPMPFPWT